MESIGITNWESFMLRGTVNIELLETNKKDILPYLAVRQVELGLMVM